MGEKLKAAAADLGVDAQIDAVAMNEIDDADLTDTDCILISPQVRYMKNDVESMVNDKTAVLVMDSIEFGLMQADKIMARVVEAVK